MSLQLCQFVFNTVRDGLLLLSDWSSRVLQQSAWKYAHPNVSVKETPNMVEYERVVKLNYNQEERFVLVEFIAMMKVRLRSGECACVRSGEGRS